jgi:hypothetical protein
MSLGVRLGFFPGFEGADSVLVHGTSAQIYTLIPRLYEFLASNLTEWPIHEHAVVSRRHPARLFASRWGMSDSTGFRWRCSPAELPVIQAVLQTLAAKGFGHHFFELPGSTARLVVSVGEYPETWWHASA